MGAGCIWVGFTIGYMPWYMWPCVFMGIVALGMWFNIRACGYVFSFFCTLSSLLSIVSLLVIGFSTSRCATLLFTVYSAWISYNWAREISNQ